MTEESPGARIRAARLEKGWTQKDLARAVGAFEKSVSRWENNRRTPSDADFDTISTALGKTKVYLRYGMTEEVARETMGSGVAPITEPGSDPVSRPLPMVLSTRKVRTWLAELRLELTKAGASDEHIRDAMALVTAPEVFMYYQGNTPAELNENEAIAAMEAIAKAIRHLRRSR
jgi:hypothetical protein